MPFYAVSRGRAPGIYPTWGECSAQVQNFSGARYKKCGTESEAREFINGDSGAAAAAGLHWAAVADPHRRLGGLDAQPRGGPVRR